MILSGASSLRAIAAPFAAARRGVPVVALSLLAACSEPDLSDPRTRSLMAMPAPLHYAERRVAREMAGQCPGYTYDEKLAEAISRARLKAGAQAALEVRGATDLEADIKRRSLTARYGGVYDPCTILNGELAAQTPLSVLVKRRG